MTVKIIKSEPDFNVVQNIVCRSCGVTLEYVPIDVKRRDEKDWSGGPDGAEWIDCPNCTKQVIIKRW
jgi:hypothetical protein